jgi:hypothetical protein
MIDAIDAAPDEGSAHARALLMKLLADRGFTLTELSDGSYLVSRWNYSRPLADLHAAAVFARQAGGA